MSFAEPMLDTTPRELAAPKELLIACIDACLDCAQACTACADACLGEEGVADLTRCIRTDLDCAATARIVTRQTDTDVTLLRATLQACATACKVCGDECAEHGEHGMEHCRICAEACRACERACRALLAAL